MTGSPPRREPAPPPTSAPPAVLSATVAPAAPWFTGEGEMRARCRAFDWAATPLGPTPSWPASLRSAADVALASAFPTLLLWGPELVILYNDAYPALAGGRHPAALGRRARDVWPENWHTTAPLLERAWRGETVTVADVARTVHRGGDGAAPEPTHFTISYAPVRAEDGAVGGILITAIETTAALDRHERARALRESEARYRSLFESLDDGFCVIEMLFDENDRPVDYRFLEANASFMEQTGLVDAVGRTARELVPSLEDHWFETYGRVATTGEAIRFQNGSEPMGRWFDVFAFRTGLPDERTVALLFKDVSAAHHAAKERERLLAALEIERSRLREVFQRAPSFIVVFRGPEHRYEFVNEAYYQLVGERDLVGRPLLEALPELRDQGFQDLLDRVLATGEPCVGRETPALLQRSPGGPPETRHLNMVIQPLVEADGSRSGVVAHGYDVTEQVVARREVERLLKDSERARAEAEAANRSKSEFLAVMSHELRTPLNAIGGYTDILEMGVHGPVNDAQRQSLSRIQLSQRHLLGLINEVLNYARLETGKVHYDIADTPVRDALSTAESLVAPQARARDLELFVGDCPPDLTVRADAEKLRQILVNLLSNAVKFSERGDRIEVTCARVHDTVRIAVADTGIGIPPDKLDAIFDPFVQVRGGLTRTHEGAGLGLAISRDLARSMRGDLTAESTPGVGSTFLLTLPAR